MKTAVFSTQPYDQQFLAAANREYQHELAFFAETTLSNISAFEAGRLSGNELLAESVMR